MEAVPENMTRRISVQDPERRLALAYAPAHARDGLALLWALDEQLGAIVAGVRDPTLAELRLAWWSDALRGLAEGRPQVDPILKGLGGLPCDPAELARLPDGWSALLGDLPLSPAALESHGVERGRVLFRQAARLLGGDHPSLDAAGEGWALADLSARFSDPATVTASRVAALRRLSAVSGRWERRLRALCLLAALARRDAGHAGPRVQGAPARLLRAFWAGVSGY